jgi:hypothetical protein
MLKFRNVREFLDWVAYGKLLIDLALTLAGVTAIKALLATFTKIPQIWMAPIEWLGGAILLWTLLCLTKGWGERREEKQWLTVASSAIKKENKPFNIKEFLGTVHKSDLQPEMESNVTQWLNELPTKEREVNLTRFIASGLIAYMHDQTWWTIYRSQIAALEHLNREVLRREAVRAYYDAAVEQYPTQYANYSFEQWLRFLLDRVLIIELPGDTIGITQRGKDYLKHMVHYGYASSGRSL